MCEKKKVLTFDELTYEVRGRPFSIVFPQKYIEDALDFRPNDGDIVLASYIKSGSTWMQYTIMQILSKGEWLPSLEEARTKLFPFIEMAGTDVITAMPEPRTYKHHMPYDRIPKNPKAKVIFIYRHPEDLLVSYFHFIKTMHPEVEIPFDSFFESFMAGKVGNGGYFPFLRAFLAASGDQGLLLVSYEKFKAKTRDEILRIAEFLGAEYKTQLLHDPALLEKVLLHTSFDYMKNNLEPDNPVTKGKDPLFFRKGKVGDGKNLISIQQLTRLKAKAYEEVDDAQVLEDWYGKK